MVYTFSVIGTPIAAPAGETCLKLAAAGKPNANFSSFTNGHALRESKAEISGQHYRFERESRNVDKSRE